MEEIESYFPPSLFLGKAELLRPGYPSLFAVVGSDTSLVQVVHGWWATKLAFFDQPDKKYSFMAT